MLKNYMEDMVAYWLPRVLSEHDEQYAQVCKCPDCLRKMRLYALNKLPVCCVETTAQSAVKRYRELYGQMLAQVLSALDEAICTVDKEVRKDTGREAQSAHDGAA